MSEDRQLCFSVKGLIAPEKEIIFDNLLVRGIPPSHNASIFFKATIKDEEDRDKLKNIAQVYALVADTYVEVFPGSSSSKISSEHPFGDPKLQGRFGLIPVFDEERRRKNIPVLEKTVKKYESIKDVFQSRKKGYVRNAIDYYYRSLRDDRLEEKLIDLMVSLESLFSKEIDELGLRYSLRTSFLLSVGQEGERSNIYKNIKALYGKRSRVIHGTEAVNLNSSEISTFQEYVRDSIKRFIHIEMSKHKFLELLDESVYDKEKRDKLNQMVSEAIKKW